MSPHPFARAIAPVSVALCVALGAAACFSERAATTQAPTAAPCNAPGSAAGTTIIFIRAFTYQTNSVRVKAGQKVTWVNCEPTPIPHTATADAAGGFTTGNLAKDASSVLTFSAAGTFPYHCALHPSMKATVIVD